MRTINQARSEGGFEGFGRTPLFRPVTIEHASINAWHTYVHPLSPIEMVWLRQTTYVGTIRDESYTLHARSVRGGSLSLVSPSDRLASCQHATSVLSSAKRKAAEQDGKA